MKVQLNPGTRIQFGDGTFSDYGPAIVDVPEELGVALTSGPAPAGHEVREAAEKPAARKKEK